MRVGLLTSRRGFLSGLAAVAASVVTLARSEAADLRPTFRDECEYYFDSTNWPMTMWVYELGVDGEWVNHTTGRALIGEHRRRMIFTPGSRYGNVLGTPEEIAAAERFHARRHALLAKLGGGNRNIEFNRRYQNAERLGR